MSGTYDAAKAKKAAHMTRRKSNGLTFEQLAREFGTSKSTAHRKVSKHTSGDMFRDGYTRVR